MVDYTVTTTTTSTGGPGGSSVTEWTDTSINNVWTGWVDVTTSNTTTVGTYEVVWHEWIVTREQKQEARKRTIQARRKQEEIAARAKRLLFTLLSDEEQIEFRRYGSVRIAGERNIYEIGECNDAVVVLDKEGAPQHQLCLHPPLSYPKPDRLAATLLALRFDEAETVKRGNKEHLSNRTRARIVARRNHRAAA